MSSLHGGRVLRSRESRSLAFGGRLLLSFSSRKLCFWRQSFTELSLVERFGVMEDRTDHCTRWLWSSLVGDFPSLLKVFTLLSVVTCGTLR